MAQDRHIVTKVALSRKCHRIETLYCITVSLAIRVYHDMMSDVSSLSACRFNEKLQLNVVDGPVLTVPLLACGRGSTLVTDPPLGSVLDLGPQFSCMPLCRTFLLTNSGRRHQTVTWSTDGFPATTRKSSSWRHSATAQGKGGKSKVDGVVVLVQAASCLF